MSDQEIIIPHPRIELQRDQRGKTYFLICDPRTGIAYFAFCGQVKRGWHDLTTKFLKAQVVLIKSLEGNKVISLKTLIKKDLRKDKYAYLFNPTKPNFLNSYFYN